MEMQTSHSLAEIESWLADIELVKSIHVFGTVTSTNDAAKRLAANGAGQGTVVIADTQTAGRGRRQRTWFSPPHKGLWFSLVLEPGMSLQESGIVQIAAAVAVATAITDHTGLQPQLKWPNDVLIAGKKVCGILAETDSGIPGKIVLGIGVNVHQSLQDFPPSLRLSATSLAIETEVCPDRSTLLRAIARDLQRFYRDIQSDRHEEVQQRWLAMCAHQGCRLEVSCGSRILHGEFVGIERFGELRLQTGPQQIQLVRSGTVRILP